MRARRFGIVAVTMMALAPGSSSAQGALPALDADITTVYTLADGRQVNTEGRYYRSRDGKQREESSLGAVITDVKRGTVTVLNHARKEAVVIAVPRARRMPKPTPSRDMSGRMVNEEGTLDGRAVSKARTAGDRGGAHEEWTAKELGLVVFSKMDSPGMTMAKSLRNVMLREPAAELFTVPRGYGVRKLNSKDAGLRSTDFLPAAPAVDAPARVSQ